MRRCPTVAAAMLAALALTVSAQAQTVDEVVAKNIAAKGGADKWKSVNAVKMTGKVSLQGMDMPLVIYTKRPNLSRQEITMHDQKMIQAFDGTTPWMLNPAMGMETPQPLTGAQADMIKADADFDGALVGYKEKGHTAELVGKEKAGDKDVYHLKLTKKSGHVQHFYLDATSGLEVKTTQEMEIAGMKQTLETELSDYKSVDGIMVPHTVRQLVGGQTIVQMTVEKVELNPPTDESLFKMPAAPKKDK